MKYRFYMNSMYLKFNIRYNLLIKYLYFYYNNQSFDLYRTHDIFRRIGNWLFLNASYRTLLCKVPVFTKYIYSLK